MQRRLYSAASHIDGGIVTTSLSCDSGESPADLQNGRLRLYKASNDMRHELLVICMSNCTGPGSAIDSLFEKCSQITRSIQSNVISRVCFARTWTNHCCSRTTLGVCLSALPVQRLSDVIAELTEALWIKNTLFHSHQSLFHRANDLLRS